MEAPPKSLDMYIFPLDLLRLEVRCHERVGVRKHVMIWSQKTL